MAESRDVPGGYPSGFDPDAFVAELRGLRPGLDEALIRRALHFCAEDFGQPFHVGGEPYFFHLVAVARTLAELGLDSTSIAAGLLHETLESVPAERAAAFETSFGPEMHRIVEDALRVIQLPSGDGEHALEMVCWLIRDPRALLVRLAARLRTMRRLACTAGGHLKRIATETRRLFIPLAARLGVSDLRMELEDLAFRALEPEAYEQARQRWADDRERRQVFAAQFSPMLRAAFASRGIAAEVSGFGRHIHELHQRSAGRAGVAQEPYEAGLFRVSVDSLAGCYRALDVIREDWPPVGDDVRDFIEHPERNLYRALHTRVAAADGQEVEVRLGTRETWKACRNGIAAYWWQGDDAENAARKREQHRWLRYVHSWLRGRLDMRGYIHYLETGRFPREIVVFTSTGVRVVLPAGATILELAEALEPPRPEICFRATVNGRRVDLDRPLVDNDVIGVPGAG